MGSIRTNAYRLLAAVALLVIAGRITAQSPATPPTRAAQGTTPAAQTPPPAAAPATAAAPPVAPPAFTPEEQQARQEILTSTQWETTRLRFDTWLTIQKAYDATQVEAIKRELTAQIAAMPAAQLKEFLAEMKAKLDVLLSPDVTAARSWADQFYTPEGQRNMLQERGLSDPASMTGEQLVEALERFAGDRQQRGAAQASYQQGLQAQTAANTARAKEQRAAAVAAAAAPARQSSGGSPYAPKLQERPQRYQAPYRPVNYGVDPWGGVWIGW